MIIFYLIKRYSNDKSTFNQLNNGNRDKILDYFMNIKDKIILGDLKLY